MNLPESGKRRSIVRDSGQAWKGVVGLLLLVAGAALVYWTLSAGYDASDETKFDVIALGLVLSVTGFAYPLVSIRCPFCGDRWLWQAAKNEEHRAWLKVLLAHERCPACNRAMKP